MNDWTLPGALVLAFFALTGCSSSSTGGTADDGGSGDSGTSDLDSSGPRDPCVLTSKCANDPVFTSAQLSNCELGRKHGCTAEYDAFLLCGHDKARCTADGKTDGAAQLVDCKAEYDTFITCLGPVGQPDAGHDGG